MIFKLKEKMDFLKWDFLEMMGKCKSYNGKNENL